jgi:hypothetical protein
VVVGATPHLQVSVNVQHCPFISDATLELLGRHVKGLMELDVSFCVAITSKGLVVGACLLLVLSRWLVCWLVGRVSELTNERTNE